MNIKKNSGSFRNGGETIIANFDQQLAKVNSSSCCLKPAVRKDSCCCVLNSYYAPMILEVPLKNS